MLCCVVEVVSVPPGLGPSRHCNDKWESTSGLSFSAWSSCVEEREIMRRGTRIIASFEL